MHAVVVYLSVRLSVCACVSVTLRYCVKTTVRITQIIPHDRPRTLVFKWDVLYRSCRISTDKGVVRSLCRSRASCYCCSEWFEQLSSRSPVSAVLPWYSRPGLVHEMWRRPEQTPCFIWPSAHRRLWHYSCACSVHHYSKSRHMGRKTLHRRSVTVPLRSVCSCVHIVAAVMCTLV